MQKDSLLEGGGERASLLLERLCPLGASRVRGRAYAVRPSDGCIRIWGHWRSLASVITQRKRDVIRHRRYRDDPKLRAKFDFARAARARANRERENETHRDWYRRNAAVARPKEYARRARRDPLYGLKSLIDRVRRGEAKFTELTRRLDHALERLDAPGGAGRPGGSKSNASHGPEASGGRGRVREPDLPPDAPQV